MLPDHEIRRKAGSVGLPIFHAGARIMDEDGRPCGPNEVGELQIAGPHLCSGYWGNPDASRQAYPVEVEEVLYQHPAVAEAAVVGVPDPLWGEVGKAVIALRPGQGVSEQELIAFCRDRLAPYKVPRRVEFRASLPKSAAGKILKRELRASGSAAGESGA